jgi:hypothetical protein
VTGRSGSRTEGGAQTERPEPLRTGLTQPRTPQTGQAGQRSAGGQARSDGAGAQPGVQGGDQAERGGAPEQRTNRISRLITGG